MADKYITIEGRRTGYSVNQIYPTLTLGELSRIFASLADEYGTDTAVVLRNDNGYTFGEISESSFGIVDSRNDEDYEDIVNIEDYMSEDDEENVEWWKEYWKNLAERMEVSNHA